MPSARRCLLTVLALLASSGGPALALDPQRSPTQYVHAVWRAPQTLPHDDVTAIVQARDGYLWLGTVEGLARFDGVRSVVFDKSNTPALTNNWVKALIEDRTGRLWIGTYGGGLVCREAAGFVRYGAAQGLPHDIVMALAEDRRGGVWAGVRGGGVFRLLPGSRHFERAPGTEQTAGINVRALFEDRAGALWIGSEQGLFRFQDGVLRRLTRANGLPDDRVLTIEEDEQGLWIGTERGGLAHLLDGHVTTVIGVREGLAHERVWSLGRDRHGNLWIGTDGGGLQRLSGGRLAGLSTKNGLNCDYVWAIREDREGSLWVATNGGGLHRLKDGSVVPFSTREGLPSEFVWSVRRARDGSLWVGTEDAGAVRLQGGRVTRFTTREGLASNQVRALLETRDGSVWLGGLGLYRFRDGRLSRVALPGLANVRVRALAEDAEGRLWIATADEGMLRLTSRRVERQAFEDLGHEVGGVTVTSDGTVWVSSIGGLHSLKAGRARRWGTADGLPSDAVSSVAEDPEGDLWVGTRGGLAHLQGGRFHVLTTQQGLEDDAIMQVLPDDTGGLWMGTNRGLFHVDRRQAIDVMEGRRTAVTSRHLGLEDGLRNVEINSAGSSAWKDPDGRLWFATRDGLASLDPARLTRNLLPPPVAIEEVLADDRALAGRGGWRLAPGTLRLEIHYTGLSLQSPSAVRFKRRLEGFDAEWVDAGTRRVADYTNLPHGRYRFRVLAANNDGAWNEQGAAVEFTIQPRLHETTWFRSLVGALLVFAGPMFYVARVRRLRHQKAGLERLVAARTTELQAATERLAQLSRQDPLTGVANRRHLDEAVEDEWRRAIRQRSPLGLVLLDVDCFKAYNDQLGHPAGDTCLKAVAASLAEAHRRAGEVVARYGGEEFAVLLPGATPEGARAAAEELRRRVQALGLPHPGSSVASVVTVSVGAAWALPGGEVPPESLLAAADRALYRAKSGGRNRVESGS